MKATKTLWAPSIHRNIYGRADHALDLAIWGWKVRVIKGTLDDIYASPKIAEGTGQEYEKQVDDGNLPMVNDRPQPDKERNKQLGDDESNPIVHIEIETQAQIAAKVNKKQWHRRLTKEQNANSKQKSGSKDRYS